MSRTETNENRILIDFDDAFSQARTAQRLSVSEVARSTRLPETVIETIESGDFTDASTDVYMRGYINIYAKYLNLDENDLLKRFDEQKPAFNQSVESSVIAGYSDHHTETQQHSLLFTALTVAVVIGILAAAYTMVFEGKIADYLGLNETNNTTSLEGSSVNLPNTIGQDGSITSNLGVDTGTTLPTVGLTSDVTGESNTDLSSTLPIDTTTNNSLEGNGALPAQGLSDGDESAGELPDVTTLSLESTADTDLPENATENVSENTDGAADVQEGEAIAANADGTTTLSMTFSDDCWISVKDATGTTVATGLYKKGKSMSVNGTLPLRIKVPREWATQNVTLGGKSIKIKDFPKQSGRYVLK